MTALPGLLMTLAVYLAVDAVHQRSGRRPVTNPVLWTVIVLIATLRLTGYDYGAYREGGRLIHALLAPAVVAMAWPLWQRRMLILGDARALVGGALAGGAAGALSAVLLARLLGLPDEMVTSIATRSITSPVAMGITERIGGVPALAAVFSILSGILGAVTGPKVMSLAGIRGSAAGFAIGTASHGIGTAQVMQEDREAGSYASVGMSLQAIIGGLIVAALWRIFG